MIYLAGVYGPELEADIFYNHSKMADVGTSLQNYLFEKRLRGRRRAGFGGEGVLWGEYEFALAQCCCLAQSG